MEQRDDGIRGGIAPGIDASVDLGKTDLLRSRLYTEGPGKRQLYSVRVERTTVFESEFFGTPEEVIHTAKREADGNGITQDERVSVWIPGLELPQESTEDENEADMWAAYNQEKTALLEAERDLAALSDEEPPFPL